MKIPLYIEFYYRHHLLHSHTFQMQYTFIHLYIPTYIPTKEYPYFKKKKKTAAMYLVQHKTKKLMRKTYK